MGGVHETVSKLLGEVCGVEPSTIAADGTLLGYGLDSVRAVELVCALEESFGIAIPDAEVAQVRTVADVAGLVERLAAGANESP